MKRTLAVLVTFALGCSATRRTEGRWAPPEKPASLAGRTFVVYNSTAGPASASRAIADYYVAKRGIPAVNEMGYAFPDTRTISAAQSASFKSTLQTYLNTHDSSDSIVLKNKIIYIVFSYLTPFNVSGSGIFGPARYEAASLDSFVSDLYGEAPVWASSSKFNPYSAVQRFVGVVREKTPPDAFQTLADYRDNGDARTRGYPNNGPGLHVYSVWRIDAPTQAQAQKIIDDSIFVEQNGLHGKFYFGSCGAQDGTRCGYDPCEGSNCLWRSAADMVYNASQIAAGSPKIGTARVVVDYDTNNRNPPTPDNPDGEFLWGDGYRDVFAWNRGSFGISFRSAPLSGGPRAGVDNAILDDPQGWSTGAIDRGVVATAGATTEPTAQGIPAQDVVWRALVEQLGPSGAGANMGDAFFRAEMMLSWQVINVGDPLYVPFP